MMGHFGWKSTIGVIINTLVVGMLFKGELTGKITNERNKKGEMTPSW